MIDPNKLEARVYELGENLESELEEIYDTVCQEYNLNGDSLAQELDCKCPYALTGFVSELSEDEISQYSLK